ncbi:MAG: peptide chain release factor N(5)-glutamine methyltransferase [Aquabacterium sp.]
MTSSFTAPLTVAQALRHARELGLDRLDAELLLGHILHKGRAWLLAHDDACLSAEQQVPWLQGLHRRAAGEPLAYIVGHKEFHGLTLSVTPDVLVPRPDTETLVDWALEILAARPAVPAPCVLDLGTGSGAIALALAHRRPDAQITAVDASQAALDIAQANARRLGLNVDFRHGHWLQPVTGRHFELIVSNPPYIAEDDPHMAALGHEPRQALTAGPDGLADLRSIVTQAPDHLSPGGHLLLEHGYDQAVAVSQLLVDRGFINVSTRFDLGGQARCTGGLWPAAHRV